MTPHQIVEKLKAEGIKLAVDCDRIKLSPATRVTAECKALVISNKTALLSYLGNQSNEQNCGSRESSDATPMADTPKVVPDADKPFKEYIQPDGTVVRVTKEQFEREVARFLLLFKQDQKVKLGSGVA